MSKSVPEVWLEFAGFDMGWHVELNGQLSSWGMPHELGATLYSPDVMVDTLDSAREVAVMFLWDSLMHQEEQACLR